MARNLNARERRKLGEQALDLKAVGLSDVSIAERIGVNRKTVPGLIEDAAAEAEGDSQFIEAAKAKTHYRRIIRNCWTRLVDNRLSPNSNIVPALIAQATTAQMRLDKLNGIEAPIKLKAEVESVMELARRNGGIPPEQRLRLIEDDFEGTG